MLFSIIIPVYNVEKYLEECLQSIITQLNSMSNLCEILLIDDGSTDTSGKLCDIYQEKYPHLIKVFHKENQGLLKTRRFGFKHASGDYIINCDSDDLLEYGMIRKLHEIIKKYNKPDIILINFNRYDGHRKIPAFQNIFTNDHDCLVTKDDILREYMLRHSIVSICGKIVKRSCINLNKTYDEFGRISTGEDTLQSIEFFQNSETFVYLNEALYDYRYDTGMTGKFDNKYYFTFKQIFEEIKKEKGNWDLTDFDRLFSIKVLQTAGRAITQSRYKRWTSLNEHKKYLLSIREDELYRDNIRYLNDISNNLQRTHFVLLKLLENKGLSIICFLLRLKNILP